MPEVALETLHEPVVAVATKVQLPIKVPPLFRSSIVTVALTFKLPTLNSGVESPVTLSVLDDPVSEAATKSGTLGVVFHIA